MSSEYIIDPTKIEITLSSIWASLQGKGKVRASLFNLIIYTKKDARTDYFYKVAQKVIDKFPSRILFITIDEQAPKGTLKTSVSAIASDSEKSSVACDLINIVLSEDNKERAPFIILPHILTDLPTYLLWGDDPTKIDPISQKIEKLATRVIFDSETTDNLPSFAAAILKHKSTSGSDIADLNWARTEGWRHLLAETFKAEEDLQTLKEASSLSITYNEKSSLFFCHTKIQSLYLQGWLASQLGWTFVSCVKEDSKTLITYQKEKGIVKVSLSPLSNPNDPPGKITELLIESEKNEHYHFTRSEDHPQIIYVQYSTPTFCQRSAPFIFDRYESGSSLVKEIFHKGTSAHYLKLVNKLATINNQAFN